MKVKIKETGEMFVQDKTPENIDWEAYRLELIKSALQGFCSNDSPQCADANINELAKWSIDSANAVIEKLKAEQNDKTK